ncbi:2Fe-2S iron-sulfur cluster-binding protein [Bradyrhizobium sp.]|uniref:2Fe-2S iron-sulfur cluster-binding protein n=1 Tax=Bradyrhizobium sp. TaxID=376 RepID=UPI0023879575|nr:2Fe-2S iron-sulfur cluster-binding protein [Bradyrhizobium sp.]MDE2377960.1 2Fe-2S iron-sulfur cluster binding domain-containing protein [Bradyrhizobium sp.]
MHRTCKVTLNRETFFANRGDLLLDRAMMSGVELPHDCRSGACGTCRVRLVAGKVFGGTEHDSDMIYACQARVVSDIEVVTEPVPDPVSMRSRVAEVARLAPDVVRLVLEVPKPLRYLPGQYCKLQFRGFPARSYSPTFPLEGSPKAGLLHFHVRKLSGGIVSSALGNGILAGHRVKITGPLGSAFFRPNHSGKIVLVSSGTGFAPMWSIAVAALQEQPHRKLLFVVAARCLRSFYMYGALCRLARFPNVVIIPVVSEPQRASTAIRNGRPTDYLAGLSPDDVVYASGAPAMTAQVARAARAAGARCYTDPFLPTGLPASKAS